MFSCSVFREQKNRFLKNGHFENGFFDKWTFFGIMGKNDIKSWVKDTFRVILWGFWILQKNVQKILKIFPK